MPIVPVVCAARAGSSATAADTLASSEANALITAADEVTRPGEVVVARGQLGVEACCSDRIRLAQVLAPLGDRRVHAREVALRRLEAPQHLAQVEPAPLEAARAVADQQRQVVARVGVELGEDLVGVHVRQVAEIGTV